ncbi:MAG: hypothetical protein J7M25_05615, partial [Deltaproteobacteria bacterium]|nr:hypothetical protein [Deltaproteobacteria bacterium]
MMRDDHEGWSRKGYWSVGACSALVAALFVPVACGGHGPTSLVDAAQHDASGSGDGDGGLDGHMEGDAGPGDAGFDDGGGRRDGGVAPFLG